MLRQSKALEELSLTDALTGLTNRRGFLSIGKKLLLVFEREVQSAAVIFIDLNDLKKTNDSLGHEVGDQMICEFAQVLRETFRQADLIARLGGRREEQDDETGDAERGGCLHVWILLLGLRRRLSPRDGRQPGARP